MERREMTCPVCGKETRVIESATDGERVYRHRKCMECGYCFHTIEEDCNTDEARKILRSLRTAAYKERLMKSVIMECEKE